MPVSVRDVAQAAAVSVGTVSNVLNRPDKVSAATVAKVLRTIDELGFVRNDAARQLRAGRSRSIGLVVLDIGNPFFADLARGAEERAGAEGLSLLITDSDEDATRQRTHVDLFREQRVAGVLITPVDDDLSGLQRLKDAGVRVVLVDREIPGAGFASVSVDDVEGGHVAVSHLIACGRRRIAFVGGPRTTRQVADRLRGARRAIEGRPDVTLEVIEEPALTVLHGRAAGTRLRERPAAERPDAVFAANDLLAVGVLQAFALMGGIRVPDDIAIVGYDDIDFAAAAVVPLTSVRQPARLIGATAVDLLVADDRDERAIRFQPELVVRESTVG